MTQQWKLSGNAENVDWSDIAMAGRAYADNLVGEPAVSKVMHMMADEIERLRSRLAAETATTQPRNGALSGCETVPDPDSRVWETPRTPQPHATPQRGSVQGEGSFRDSRFAKEPVAWAVEAGGELEASFCGRTGLEDAADWREQSDGTIVPLYRQPQTCPHVRGNVTHYCSLNFTLTDAEREAVERAIRTLDGWQKTGGYHSAIDDDSATLRGLLERLA